MDNSGLEERAYIEGRNAAREGRNKYMTCPYDTTDPLLVDWYQGYEDYEEEMYRAFEDSPDLEF